MVNSVLSSQKAFSKLSTLDLSDLEEPGNMSFGGQAPTIIVLKEGKYFLLEAVLRN